MACDGLRQRYSKHEENTNVRNKSYNISVGRYRRISTRRLYKSSCDESVYKWKNHILPIMIKRNTFTHNFRWMAKIFLGRANDIDK